MSLVRSATCLIFALAFSQFPAFESLYQNRLQARLLEVQRQMQLFEQAAQTSGCSLEHYIEIFRAQSQKPIQEAANVMMKTQNRKDRLELTLQRLEHSYYPFKLWVLLTRLEPEMLRDAWQHYQGALVLNTSSAAFAASGALLGLCVYSMFKALTKRALKRLFNKGEQT